MKLNNILLTAGAAFALAVLAIGCSPTVVTEYDANTGKITKVTESGGSELSTKDISTSGALSAVKVETTGGSSTGTAFPNVLVGSGVVGISASPRNSTRPIMGASCSYGFISSMWNSKAASWEVRYIGAPGESADDTAKRMKALQDYRDSSISGATSTDTTSTNALMQNKTTSKN